jgi:hypothetical protein
MAPAKVRDVGATLSAAEIEGRLVAHRHVIQQLLRKLVLEPQDLEDLVAAAGATAPMLDHQEDPGAVPTDAFAIHAASAAELRLLLESVKPSASERSDR